MSNSGKSALMSSSQLLLKMFPEVLFWPSLAGVSTMAAIVENILCTFQSLVTQEYRLWAHGIGATWELVRSTDLQSPPQIYQIRIRISIRVPVGFCTRWCLMCAAESVSSLMYVESSQLLPLAVSLAWEGWMAWSLNQKPWTPTTGGFVTVRIAKILWNFLPPLL